MSHNCSKHLNQMQMSALLKTGDIMVPGHENFPKFSESGVVAAADNLFDHMNSGDRTAFCSLLSVLYFLPKPAVALFIRLSESHKSWPEFIAANLRLLDIGLRGVFYSLYFSAKETHEKIGWSTQIERPREESILRDAKAPSINEYDQVYINARTAGKTISTLDVESRLAYIKRLKRVIMKNEDKILSYIQTETGKSKTDAYVSEIFSTLDHLSFMEKKAAKFLSDEKVSTPIALMGKKSRIFYEPLGTVLIISPWNYPFFMATVPITSALIAGNAVVYKPSEFTPMKGLLEQLFEEAGIPKNWVQVVYGDGDTGKKLVDQKPSKIFFTGSVPTGKKIMKQAAEHLIPVELELGGKDPMIVFDDVDLDRTSSGALWGGFTNSGQACTSVERLLIHRNIYNEFRDLLVQKAKKLTQSENGDVATDLGHMTTPFQVKIIREQIEDAEAKGATIHFGKEWDRESKTVPPIIIDNVTADMKVYHEETFGPVIALIPFSTEKEAIDIANDSDYGLSASVWSKNANRAERIARNIVTGNVSINNVMLTEGNSELPFGGTKQSGIGRYRGKIGLQAFSNIKSVLIDNSTKMEANWFPYTSQKFDLFQRVTHGLFNGGVFNFVKFLISALKLESYSDKVARRTNR